MIGILLIVIYKEFSKNGYYNRVNAIILIKIITLKNVF
jgi:hypothetical protein